ncbi:serine/threonine protein kinase, partial [Streptomyces sp. NPDC002935]
QPAPPAKPGRFWKMQEPSYGRVWRSPSAVALVAAVGVGTWLATSGDDADATPQDTRNSAPASP